MGLRNEADAVLENLVEHALLHIGGDLIADAREQDSLAVKSKPAHGEHRDGSGADDSDGFVIPLKICLVDHQSEHVGVKRGAAGDHAHQRVRDRI
jgi:hypothetical protein